MIEILPGVIHAARLGGIDQGKNVLITIAVIFPPVVKCASVTGDHPVEPLSGDVQCEAAALIKRTGRVQQRVKVFVTVRVIQAKHVERAVKPDEFEISVGQAVLLPIRHIERGETRADKAPRHA